MAIVIHRRLDLQGLPCPAPVRATNDALTEMDRGDLIEVLSTDPRSVREFAVWARATGNGLLESSQFGNVFRFVIRKL